MKRTIKKVTAIFLSVVVILTVFCGTVSMTASAENEAVFSLEKVSETEDFVVVSLSLTSGEFKYATFIFSYGDKISGCTSICIADVLKDYIINTENVIATSNNNTGVATVISVESLNEIGDYFTVTFSKAVADEITEDDITVVEDDLGYEIVKSFTAKADISLSMSSITLYDGQTMQLDATLTPDTGEAITWTSSNESIATVSNGLVTAVDYGEATVTATTQGGASASCTVIVDTKMKDDVSAEIKSDDNLIFGSSVFGKTDEEIKTLFEDTNITVNSNLDKVATGDTIVFSKANGDVFKTLTVVVFGDVNCDGVYDGTDVIIVDCIAQGMLTREQVGEAVYAAADCNHDGIIDILDVELLNNAGLLLSLVPQTKEKTIDTSSTEYAEYLSCISQDIVKNDVQEEQPTEETQTSVIDIIFEAFKSIVDYIINAITELFA